MGTKNFQEHIGHHLRMVHNGIDKFFTFHNLDEYGFKLTHAQSGMVHYLYDHQEEDVFQKDLEQCFQISGATASNTLKGMEKQGVIVRTPMPDDARKKKLTLTAKGKEFHEKAIENLLNLEQTLVKGMTEKEITIYREFLKRSTQNLEEMSGNCLGKK